MFYSMQVRDGPLIKKSLNKSVDEGLGGSMVAIHNPPAIDQHPTEQVQYVNGSFITMCGVICVMINPLIHKNSVLFEYRLNPA